MKTRSRLLALTTIALILTDRQSRAQSAYEPYTFTTLAGNAAYGTADGVGSAAQFGRIDGGPGGVAVDGNGNVYVADTANSTIRKVTPAGAVTTLAGVPHPLNDFGGFPVGGSADGPANVAQFNGPQGVAADGAGNVYVADSLNNTIRKVTSEGVVTTLAGVARVPGGFDGTGSAALFRNPTGVAVDSSGNVYVADSDNYTIRKITPTGVVTTVAGQAGSFGYVDGIGSAARFGKPSGVAVDSADNLYVTDQSNQTIRKVTATGVVSTLAGTALSYGGADGTGSDARFSSPSGVAVDGLGNIYVVEYFNHTIRKVTPTGTVTTLAGQAGILFGGSTDGTGSAARFAFPTGVAVDSTGNVYVADSGNRTIRKVTPTGEVTTLAGQPGSDSSTDGTGNAARFMLPYSVAVDGAGNVYVGDWGSTIRKVTPAGVVTTLAGVASSYGSADGTGSAAQFNSPAVAVDNAGNIYVADSGNNTIRKGYSAQNGLSLFGSRWGLDGGKFGFFLTGPAGQSVVVEASSNFVNWLPVWTNTFPGALIFSDQQSGGVSNRFYRAHLP